MRTSSPGGVCPVCREARPLAFPAVPSPHAHLPGVAAGVPILPRSKARARKQDCLVVKSSGETPVPPSVLSDAELET